VFQVLEGAAAVRCAGETAAVLSGTQVGCPLDENFVTSGPPGEVEPIVPKQLDNILGILPDSVSVSPRSTEEIDEISRLWNDGLPLCDGAEFLPACDDLIETLNGEKCPINSNNDPECGNTDVSIWESVPDEAPDFEVETSGETGATGEATGIVTYVGTFTFEQKLLFNTSDCAYTEPLSIEGEFSLWVNFDEMRSTAMFSGENSGTTDYTCSLSTGATNWDLNLSSHTGGSITLNDDGTFTFETDGYAPTKYSFTYQHCEGIDDIPVTCYDPANIPISQPVTVTGTITMSDGSGSGSINFASGEEFQVSTWQTDSIVMP